MKRLLAILIACLVLVSHSACRMCGNGEPICGDKPTDTAPSAPSTGSSAVRVYYQFQTGYTCTPAGSTTPVASWIETLQIDRGSATASLGGDRCHPGIKANVPLGDVEVSINKMLAGYGDAIYVSYSGSLPPPNSAAIGAWCQPVDTNVTPRYEVIVDARPIASFASTDPTLNATLPVVKTETAGGRTYSASAVSLSIDTSASPATGRLDQSPAGFYVGDVKCRLGR